MEEINNVEGKRKRGRPPLSPNRQNSGNGESQFKHHVVKKWEAFHEAIVMESVMGRSNKQIAEDRGYSAQQISNILSTQQAAECRSRILEKVQRESGDLSQALAYIRKKATERMIQFVDNDQYAQGIPVEHMRLSMEAFKLTNAPATKESLTVVNQNTTNNNILVANPDIMKRVAAGIEMATRVQQLHAPKPEVEVIDVQAELVK